MKLNPAFFIFHFSFFIIKNLLTTVGLKSQPRFDKGIAAQCIPELFTIHYSLFTKMWKMWGQVIHDSSAALRSNRQITNHQTPKSHVSSDGTEVPVPFGAQLRTLHSQLSTLNSQLSTPKAGGF